MRVQAPDPFGAFLAGRQARQDEDYTGSRNALARQEAEDAPRVSAQRNKLAELQIGGIEQSQAAATQERKQQAYAQIGGLAQQALKSGNPREFVTAAVSNPAYAHLFQQAGIDPRQLDLNSPTFERDLQTWASVGPAPEQMSPYQQAQIDIERDKLNQPKTMSPYEQARIDIEKQKLGREKPQNTFRTLTPQEAQAAGLPAGTSAQVDQSGKIDVLSKRDNSGTLSQKDANTAKLKLTTIRVARKQLADIKQAFEAGRDVTGPNSFGPGQGMLPTERGKKFDAAVDRMRSTLTALTRVPGVGAMSDYETKLDQGKFPNRNAYESVTAEQIQGIEDLLGTIETGYTGLLSGEAPPEQATNAQEPQGEVRVSSPQEAMALPPGTVFVTPDGRRKVR